MILKIREKDGRWRYIDKIGELFNEGGKEHKKVIAIYDGASQQTTTLTIQEGYLLSDSGKVIEKIESSS